MDYKVSPEKYQEIADIYISAKLTTEQIAKKYNVSTRTIQRILAIMGVIRTAGQSNRAIAHLKNYKCTPEIFKVKRKQISQKLRYITITNHPYCTNCGVRSSDGARLEVDHIDNDPTNNDSTNLQVLCGPCNRGKAHIDKYGY